LGSSWRAFEIIQEGSLIVGVNIYTVGGKIPRYFLLTGTGTGVSSKSPLAWGQKAKRAWLHRQVFNMGNHILKEELGGEQR
jgi:hypothetical protein